MGDHHGLVAIISAEIDAFVEWEGNLLHYVLAFLVLVNKLGDALLFAFDRDGGSVFLNVVALLIIVEVLLLFDVVVLLGQLFVLLRALLVIEESGVVILWVAFGSGGGNKGGEDSKLHL